MPRVLLPESLATILRDIRIRLERLERQKIQAAAVTPAPPTSYLADPTKQPGDLIYRNSANVVDRLAIGSAGSVLQVKNLGNFAGQLLNMNPYLWYRLNEASGTTVADSSQSGAHPGTYNTTGVTYHVAPATGDGDYAVTFDGATGYAHVGSNPTGSGDFSVAFFVKTSSTAPDKLAIGTKDANGGFAEPAFSWSFLPAGQSGTPHPTFLVAGPITSSYASVYAASATLTDGNWHLVVITRALASGAVSMYIDGSPVALSNAGAASGGAVYPGSALNGGSDLYVAADYNLTDFWTGSMDEVAIWQRLLTSSEVTTLWTNVSGPAAVVESWGPAPLPAGPGDTTKFLRGDNPPTWAVPPGFPNPMLPQDDLLFEQSR